MEIQSYVVEALFLRYFKVLQPIKLILNTKLFLVCKVEILKDRVNKIEVLSSFYLDFLRFSAKNALNS